MRKELVKEVKFGRAVARITVTDFIKENMMDGWIKTGEELIINEKIEIIADGKVVESSSYAKAIEYNFLYEGFFEKMGLDKSKKVLKGRRSDHRRRTRSERNKRSDQRNERTNHSRNWDEN